MWRVFGTALALITAAPATATVVVVSFSDVDHSTFGDFSYDSSETPYFTWHQTGVDYADYAAMSDFNFTYDGNSYVIPPSLWYMQAIHTSTSVSFSAIVLYPNFSVSVSDSNASGAQYTQLPTSWPNDDGSFVDPNHLFPVVVPVKVTFSTASVPEPASWALMLGGFGAIGAAMRNRRKVAVSLG